MQDELDRERDTKPDGFGGKRMLALERAGMARKPVALDRIRILERYMDGVQPGLPQIAHGPRSDPHTGGDKGRVKAGFPGRRGDLDQVAAQAGLATGQPHIANPKSPGLDEHARPGGKIELILLPDQDERIRAVGTTQRTAVRQLGNQHGRRMIIAGWLIEHGSASHRACYTTLRGQRLVGSQGGNE